MFKKLAIITTHPIQYYAPLFKALALQSDVEVKVFYTWGNVGEQKYDPGFGKKVEWDIPLLEGYQHIFVKNTASKPGSNHFFGIQNPTLIHEILDWKASAILVFGWANQSHLRTMVYFKGKIPVYFRGDSTLLDKASGYKYFLRKLVLKWVYTHVDKAFFVGQQNKAYYQSFGLKEHQLLFAPHAIDNSRFQNPSTEQILQLTELKNELGIDSQTKTILFVGKFESKKNPVLLIEAFKTLTQQHLKLILVGNGVLELELKKISSTDTRIHFLPFQNQSLMPVVYRLGTVFCLPSQGPGETWGLAINEAMACGLPIIASDKCGASVDLVTNGVNGQIFKSNDIESLKSALQTVLESDLSISGQKSNEMIQNWSISHVSNAIIQEVKHLNSVSH